MSFDPKVRVNPSKASPSLQAKRLIHTAVATALGLSGIPVAVGQNASLEEVVVTARQRAESVQDVPMMIQALSGDEIQRRGITTLQDLSKHIGSLQITADGIGSNEIVFRGISTGGGFLQDATAAVYLDDQPMSLGGLAPDIYPIDLQRIETLAGPQSTLFGADSQSGTVRYITNKPDPSEFSGSIAGEVGSFTDGDTSFNGEFTVNVPVTDKLAIRLSGFAREDGGFIDNILSPTVQGGSDNADMVEDNYNDVSWRGGRIAARWLMSDDWTADFSVHYQDIDADGFADVDPSTGDLTIAKFKPETRTDEFLATSLVITGELDFATLVVAGSYYDRDTLYQHDTQTYASYFSYFGFGYDWGEDAKGYLVNDQNNDSKSLEVRLTGAGEKVDWTLGFFYSDLSETWDFKTYIDNYADSMGFYYLTTYYGFDIAPSDAWWFSSQQTSRETTAVFGELDWSITDNLSLLLGGRWYDVEKTIDYFVQKPEGLFQAVPSNNDIRGPQPTRTMSDDGFIPKVGLQYNFSEDVMIYGVYSEGFRTGGVNRGRSDNGTFPVAYDSDTVENKEVGIKAVFADNRIQANFAFYKMDWTDVQVELVDPSFRIGEPWQTIIANMDDGSISGFDMDIIARATDNLELGFNMTYIDENEVNAPPVPDDRFEGGFAPVGLDANPQLPLFADRSYSLYAEYGFDASKIGIGGDGYIRVQHSYTGESLNQIDDTPGIQPQETQGDYRLTDLTLGFDLGSWQATLFARNVTDERGVTFKDSSDFDRMFGRASYFIVPPRQIGVSMRRDF